MKAFFRYFDLEFNPSAEPYFNAAQRWSDKELEQLFAIERYDIFTSLLQPLCTLRDQVKGNRDNRLYCAFLYEILQSGNDDLIESVCSPRRAECDEKFDILPLFSLLYCVPAMRVQLKERGVPDSVICDTCKMFENQLQDHIDLYGRMGMAVYVPWMLLFVRGEILRIGRFNFHWSRAGAVSVFRRGQEIYIMTDGVCYHKSGRVLGSVDCTDEQGSFCPIVTETSTSYIGCTFVNERCSPEKVTLLKSEWERVVAAGDPVVNVHIPSGGPLNYDSDSRDFEKAVEIFCRCYGKFRAFFCNSWILDSEFKRILGKETNMTRFADRFVRYPAKSLGKSVFSYLYLQEEVDDLESLPEATSMQRAVKAYLLKGGHIYGGKGFILI